MTQVNEKLAQELLDIGIKPSYHRMRVLKYLRNAKNHPTVHEIFQKLQKELPTLSKATIYNTLNLFATEKLVRPIAIENNEVRYDITLKDHGHFKCESCERIYDFSIDIDDFVPKGLEGFITKDRNVYFKGECPKCV